ncbi:MAG: hypothetical protein JJV96_02270 [Alphaproteobacteria bacterium]|nr:hypothetical protein [Alphaproteobacteria bacterium]
MFTKLKNHIIKQITGVGRKIFLGEASRKLFCLPLLLATFITITLATTSPISALTCNNGEYIDDPWTWNPQGGSSGDRYRTSQTHTGKDGKTRIYTIAESGSNNLGIYDIEAGSWTWKPQGGSSGNQYWTSQIHTGSDGKTRIYAIGKWGDNLGIYDIEAKTWTWKSTGGSYLDYYYTNQIHIQAVLLVNL